MDSNDPKHSKIDTIFNKISKFKKEDILFSEHFESVMNEREYLDKSDITNKLFDSSSIKWIEDQSDRYKEPRFLLVYKQSGTYDFAIVVAMNGKIKVITAFRRKISLSDANRKRASFFTFKIEK